ncbi:MULTISPECIES: hypothetical protein [Haloarcula]|uniref:hypothetical protein n=1 Tax=Haloarcula TaxID=2237 RepID=UPI0023EE13CC|nr:hypothetical protein [Halomicroarcula sp. XH51]
MEIRDAVESDAGRLAELADSPPDVMRNLIHDRTVRVATVVGEDGDDPEVRGFISFDAGRGTVHVTQLAGPADVCERLLDEPIAFAGREGMAVELLVPDGSDDVESAVEAVGFDDTGSGPQFDGRPTVRYRLESERVRQ